MIVLNVEKQGGRDYFSLFQPVENWTEEKCPEKGKKLQCRNKQAYRGVRSKLLADVNRENRLNHGPTKNVDEKKETYGF